MEAAEPEEVEVGGARDDGSSDAYAVGSDGYTFEGEAAQQLIRGLQSAMSNADGNGNWSFDIGKDKNGNIGYWESYGFTSSEPTVIDGVEQLAGVGIGFRFVDLENNDGGHLSSRSFVFTKMTSNMYEAGVSGLFFEATVASGWSSYSRTFTFSNIYVGFPSSTMDKRHFSASEASYITAEAFNNAALSLPLHFQFFSAEDIADYQIQLFSLCLLHMPKPILMRLLWQVLM